MRGRADGDGAFLPVSTRAYGSTKPKQNTASMVQNTASMLRNTASMVQNTASMVQNTASMLRNTASMLQNTASMLQNTASMLRNTASMLRNAASMVRNEAFGSRAASIGCRIVPLVIVSAHCTPRCERLTNSLRPVLEPLREDDRQPRLQNRGLRFCYVVRPG